ncbi:MAG TPA: SDR family oxidoreductase [Streptosporangiaceae bacterium]
MGGERPPVAIITGGSRGIGAGLIQGYRRQGWAVLASARTIKPSADPDLVTVEGDIAEAATAERIIATALEHFGQVDTLVNNAGVYVSKPFTEYTAADYALVTGVNLAGFFRVTQLAITEMLRRGRGHVVNLSASVADRPQPGTPAVLAALTKGGLAMAARSLAVEYADRGIRVNAVAPGETATTLISAGASAGTGTGTARTSNGAGQLSPLRRPGQVSDVVDAVLYLESAHHITGEVLHIDGGAIPSH